MDAKAAISASSVSSRIQDIFLPSVVILILVPWKILCAVFRCWGLTMIQVFSERIMSISFVLNHLRIPMCKQQASETKETDPLRGSKTGVGFGLYGNDF